MLYWLSRCRGVCVNIEVQDFREGIDNPTISKTAAGLTHYGPLILRNVVTGSNDKLRFNITNAWSSSWRLGKLDSHVSAPLIEELVLQYETLNIA